MVVIRHELGELLRETRQAQGRTLREVSKDAAVSLGYLSEIERGEKEASSELLGAICTALDLPLSTLLERVAVRASAAERRDAACPTVALPLPARGLPAADVRASAA